MSGYEKVDEIKFNTFSLVPASKCWACGLAMKPARDIYWACDNLKCEEHGAEKHTGVYPMRKVTNAESR